MECGAKEESEKKIRRKRGREGATRSFALTPPPPPRCFFFLLLTSFCGVPWSERLEQTTLLIPETLFFELTAANSIPAFMFLIKVLLHSLRNSTQCSDTIWDNFYTLHLPQLSFSFQKHKFSVLMLFLVHSDFFGMWYQNHFDSAGQRDWSRWERELQFFLFFFLLLINYALFFAHAQWVLPLCFGEPFAWSFCTTSVASNPCTQIISSLRALFKFQVTLFDFIILFCVLAFTVFILWGSYLDREVRKTILIRHIHICISITWSIVTDVLVTFRYFTFPK